MLMQAGRDAMKMHDDQDSQMVDALRVLTGRLDAELDALRASAN